MVQQLSRTQATQLKGDNDDRGSGRISLSRTVYTAPSGQVVFNHDGNKGSRFYCCTLYSGGSKHLLGAIEFNVQTECWQVVYLGRQPYQDGADYLNYEQAVDFLISQHEQVKRQAVRDFHTV